MQAEEPIWKKKGPKSLVEGARVGSSAIIQSESGYSLSSNGLNEVLFYLYLKELTAKASAKQSGSKLRESSKLLGIKRNFEQRGILPEDIIASMDNQEQPYKRVSQLNGVGNI